MHLRNEAKAFFAFLTSFMFNDLDFWRNENTFERRLPFEFEEINLECVLILFLMRNFTLFKTVNFVREWMESIVPSRLT